jgi:hypothetical protein
MARISRTCRGGARDFSKCWLYDYDVLEAAKYSAERDDIVTLTRACHHLIASNGYDECNLARWINPIADIAVARGSLRACEAIARSIRSWTSVSMVETLFIMMHGAIRTDNTQILEFCIMFFNYYIHDSRESCHIVDLDDAPDPSSKCAEFLNKYDHCIALQRKINDEIVAKK